MTIQERIREIRKSLGLTQKQLAERMGITQSMVGQYETNEQPPKIATLENIAEALGVSMHYLQTGQNPAPLDTDDVDENSAREKRDLRLASAVLPFYGFVIRKDGEKRIVTDPNAKSVEFDGTEYLLYSKVISMKLSEAFEGNDGIKDFLIQIHEDAIKFAMNPSGLKEE